MLKKYEKKTRKIYEFYVSIQGEEEKKWKEFEFVSFLLNKNNIFILSKPNPIGYIKARVLKEEVEIISFLVDKKFRRKGEGRALLENLLLIALEKRIKNIILEVSVENIIAINLYKEFNFLIVGKRKEYYFKYGRKIDAYIMRLDLF